MMSLVKPILKRTENAVCAVYRYNCNGLQTMPVKQVNGKMYYRDGAGKTRMIYTQSDTFELRCERGGRLYTCPTAAREDYVFRMEQVRASITKIAFA